MAAMLSELVAAVLWLFAREPADAAPRVVENPCSTCHQFYTGPFAFCGFCGQAPSDHHGNCCLNHPRLHWRAQQSEQGGSCPIPGRPTWDTVPAKPKPRVPTFAGINDEPMVSWPTYGLSVPLEVWEQSVGQNSRGSKPKSI